MDVWDEVMALQRRMDDLFRTYLGERARPMFPALPEGIRRPFVPVCDVFARDKDLIVRLELPGIDPAKDVEVTVDQGALVIKGERSSKEEIQEERYYRMESSYGSFERRLPVPEGVGEDDIVADYADGVLEITLPGAATPPEVEESKPAVRQIPIKTK